jgi:hypothetical protein
VKTRQQTLEERLDREIDKMIADKLKAANLAAPISPHARVKLRGILKKYARSAHPFRECVRDNMKRFGPGRTEAVCATLKATIKGAGRKVGASENSGADDLAIDADVLLALDAISDYDLQEIFLEARALEEHGTVEATALLEVKGTTELQRWGVGHEELIRLEAADV